MKSPNRNKISFTCPRRAEYTTVNTDIVILKFIDRHKSFLTLYNTMKTFNMIMKSSNSKKKFLPSKTHMIMQYFNKIQETTKYIETKQQQTTN